MDTMLCYTTKMENGGIRPFSDFYNDYKTSTYYEHKTKA